MDASRRLARESNDLLDAVLPSRNGLAVVLYAYFDASERTNGVFSVAGFVYRKPAAKQCAKEWMKLFGRYGGCHMTDLALRQDRFEGLSRSEQERLIRGAIAIINRNATYGVAISCYVQEMSALLPKWIDGFQGAYPVCCHIAMMALGNLIRSTGPVQRVAYFFDVGDKLQGVARRFMGRAVQVPELKEAYQHSSDTFASDDEMVQLQTADVFAWEWAKYIDETVTQQIRLMRKSLAAILTYGSTDPADFNAERMKFTHLTDKPLAKFSEEIAKLGLQQIREEQEGSA